MVYWAFTFCPSLNSVVQGSRDYQYKATLWLLFKILFRIIQLKANSKFVTMFPVTRIINVKHGPINNPSPSNHPSPTPTWITGCFSLQESELFFIWQSHAQPYHPVCQCKQTMTTGPICHCGREAMYSAGKLSFPLSLSPVGRSALSSLGSCHPKDPRLGKDFAKACVCTGFIEENSHCTLMMRSMLLHWLVYCHFNT